MITLALTVLGASLLGSLHCAGMCGGLVAFYSADPRPGAARTSRALTHAAYSGGRLVAYAGLGAAAGGLGAAFEMAGALAGLQRIASVVAGGLVALWGGVALLRVMDVRLPRLPAPRGVRQGLRAGLERAAGLGPVGRALAIGVLTGALPCGWLWVFVLTAAGTASAAGGALVMGAFWLGTLPVMLGVGFGLHALWSPIRRHVPTACAVAMIVLGLVGVAGRMRALDAPSGRPAAIPGGSETGALHSMPAPGDHGRH